MAHYRTRDGDMLDAICLGYYGSSEYLVEAVLEVNPGLSDIGPVYPAGVLIELPDFPQINTSTNVIRLWD